MIALEESGKGGTHRLLVFWGWLFSGQMLAACTDHIAHLKGGNMHFDVLVQ